MVAGSSLLIHLVHLQLSSTGLHRGAIAGSQRWRTEQHGRRVILQSIAAERHSGAVAVAGGAVADSQRRRDGAGEDGGAGGPFYLSPPLLVCRLLTGPGQGFSAVYSATWLRNKRARKKEFANLIRERFRFRRGRRPRVGDG